MTLISRVLKKVREQRAPRPNILRTLFAVQEAQGYVPSAALPQIAEELGMTEAEVAGVLSFYPDLRKTAPGRHIIRLCLGESCMANHCPRVLKELEKRLGIRVGETTRDGRFTLEKMYCAGNCAVSPTVMIDEEVHGRMTAPAVAALLKEYR